MAIVLVLIWKGRILGPKSCQPFSSIFLGMTSNLGGTYLLASISNRRLYFAKRSDCVIEPTLI